MNAHFYTVSQRYRPYRRINKKCYFISVSFPVMTPSGQRLTVLSKSLMGLSTSATTVNKVVGGVVTTTSGTSGRPVMRVPPLNVAASQGQSTAGNGQTTHQQTLRCGIITRHAQKESEKAQAKEQPKSEFHLVNHRAILFYIRPSVIDRYVFMNHFISSNSHNWRKIESKEDKRNFVYWQTLTRGDAQPVLYTAKIYLLL